MDDLDNIAHADHVESGEAVGPDRARRDPGAGGRGAPGGGHPLDGLRAAHAPVPPGHRHHRRTGRTRRRPGAPGRPRPAPGAGAPPAAGCADRPPPRSGEGLRPLGPRDALVLPTGHRTPAAVRPRSGAGRRSADRREESPPISPGAGGPLSAKRGGSSAVRTPWSRRSGSSARRGGSAGRACTACPSSRCADPRRRRPRREGP